ncbi:MAG TPA: PKD domain-containing protein [Chitinophagaceae bacterium]
MRRAFFLYIILTCVAYIAKADHITGGEISYTLKTISGSQYTYSVTVKMYMICNTYREFYNPAYITVFDKKTNERLKDLLVTLTKTEIISLDENDQCIINPPQVCHRIGYYNFDLTLPASPNGYILTTEVFFRVYNLSNLAPGYGNIGATYTAEIPGTFLLPSGPKNNSARFIGSDLVIICAGHPFTYSFAAEDKDGDTLKYSLCSAYRSDNFLFGVDLFPPAPPPYAPVPYGAEYSGGNPFGNKVSIDGHTGLISGIAPDPGTYVITVCVEEWRDGKFIATQRKDLQINVAACSFGSASLPASYLLCGNSKTINLENLSMSPLVETYKWRITDNTGSEIYTSTSPIVNYTFEDTGLFNVRLDVNAEAKCADSARSVIRVYPGLKPDFSYDNPCLNTSTQFTDGTSSAYGKVNSWNWNFGDTTKPSDSSALQNPVYTYQSLGIKNISLRVTDSKGCIDTIYKNMEIFDKPPVRLAFADTLICKPDTLQLIASGAGEYKWTPLIDISNTNSAQPTVVPKATTTYYVDLTLNGCTNRDSVTVHVVDHVTLKAMSDTTICSGDSIQLHIASDGLKYNWLPASQLNNATTQQPTAYTVTTTKYNVTAIIGACNATDAINVTTIPYPVAVAGMDTVICFGTEAILNGITDGSSYVWFPPEEIADIHALHTTVFPHATTTYILTANDTKGCPKPGIDSVTINVLPKIIAYAGHDTSVVINQPLQLNGSGGSLYQWIPPTGLSSSTIPDPVAVFTEPLENGRYKLLVSNDAGCSDSAFINIKVYKTLPSVFVPTGFTPNGDGRNDILRPVMAGMQRLEAFNVFNRSGQLVYSTNVPGKGWDGRIDGILQASGTFVWTIKAVDYNGLPYFNKGTVTLIR